MDWGEYYHVDPLSTLQGEDCPYCQRQLKRAESISLGEDEQLYHVECLNKKMNERHGIVSVPKNN